jgi:hypothetical protein
MQTALEVSTVRSWKFSDLVRADIVKKVPVAIDLKS